MQKIMKKMLIFLVGILVSATGSTDTSQSMILMGIVPAIQSIFVAPEEDAADLNLSSGSVFGLRAAAITEISNRAGGYIVTVASANGGILDGILTDDFLAYSLTYNGVAVGSLASATPVTITDTSVKTTVQGITKMLEINYSPGEDLHGDTYTDTLTFEIIAK